MTAAINTAPEHSEHIETLRRLKEKYKSAWEKRFKQAKLDRQLSDEVNPSELAEYFTTLIQGMTIKAKDGASRDTLISVTNIALKTLNQFINKQQR
jgi:hypothetical protein